MCTERNATGEYVSAGCQPFECEISVAISNKRDELLNETPTSLPSPRAEMAMSWVCHFSVVTP